MSTNIAVCLCACYPLCVCACLLVAGTDQNAELGFTLSAHWDGRNSCQMIARPLCLLWLQLQHYKADMKSSFTVFLCHPFLISSTCLPAGIPHHPSLLFLIHVSLPPLPGWSCDQRQFSDLYLNAFQKKFPVESLEEVTNSAENTNEGTKEQEHERNKLHFCNYSQK